MKTMYKIAMLISVISLFALPVYAGNGTTSTGGDTVTVDGSNSGGGDLTFTPSANTVVAWATTDKLYTIATASTKTNTTNGIEYGMTSAYNGFYQRKQATDEAVGAQTTAGALDGTWVAMGGGGSS